MLEGGLEYPAERLPLETDKDVALLQVQSEKTILELAPLFLSTAAIESRKGEDVYALYFDFQEKKVKTSEGVLSEKEDLFLQSTAAIPLGGSGGPLMDSSGQVIGMNVGLSKSDPKTTLSLPSEELRITSY